MKKSLFDQYGICLFIQQKFVDSYLLGKFVKSCLELDIRSEEPVFVDIEILAKNAKRALVHERYIKETQQSKGNSSASNLAVFLSNRIPELKAIFDQMLIWFNELVGVYRANLVLAKKIRDAQPNLDVSSLEEKSETDIGRDLSNTVGLQRG